MHPGVGDNRHLRVTRKGLLSFGVWNSAADYFDRRRSMVVQPRKATKENGKTQAYQRPRASDYKLGMFNSASSRTSVHNYHAHTRVLWTGLHSQARRSLNALAQQYGQPNCFLKGDNS